MWEKELRAAIDAGRAASKVILDIYHRDFEVEIKEDQSPVTMADKLADQLIRKLLHADFPTYDFLTEESIDDAIRLDSDYVWIVDPVDGTKDFVNKKDEFTTNIALSYKHEIVVGVIVVPVSGLIYYATKGGGAYRINKNTITKLTVSDRDDNLTVLASRFHLKEAEIDLFTKYQSTINRVETCGSSLKACRIAEGSAELSYRLSDGTKEWDIAANQLIVEEAGGVLLKPDFTKYKYNRADVVNREGYIIANKQSNILL